MKIKLNIIHFFGIILLFFIVGLSPFALDAQTVYEGSVTVDISDPALSKSAAESEGTYKSVPLLAFNVNNLSNNPGSLRMIRVKITSSEAGLDSAYIQKGANKINVASIVDGYAIFIFPKNASSSLISANSKEKYLLSVDVRAEDADMVTLAANIEKGDIVVANPSGIFFEMNGKVIGRPVSVNAQSSSKNVPISEDNVYKCYKFTKNLKIGSTGADVSALQSYLIENGYDIPAISSGRAPKGYFGQSTAVALEKMQSQTGIIAVGSVGPVTREYINKCQNRIISENKIAASPVAASSTIKKIENHLTPLPVISTPVPTSSYTSIPTPYMTPVSTSPSATPAASAASTASPTATLTVQGTHNYSFSVGETANYYWNSSNADTFSSTYTSTNAAMCGAGGSWSANTSSGYTSSLMSSSAAGCYWTVTYTAKNSKTGQSASDTITVKVNPTVSPSASPSATPSSSPSAHIGQNNLIASIWAGIKSYFEKHK